MTPPSHESPRSRYVRGRGAGCPERTVSPTLGHPIESAADARAVWRQYFGDQPVPAPQWRPDPALEQLWREEAQRAQITDALQRLTAANDLPLPELRAAWTEAFTAVRAVFEGQPTPEPKGVKA